MDVIGKQRRIEFCPKLAVHNDMLFFVKSEQRVLSTSINKCLTEDLGQDLSRT